MGNIDSAEVYIRKAVARIDDDPVLFSHLGDILFKKGDFTGALEAYKKAVELKCENQDATRLKIIELERLLKSGGTR
jgi:uncharacterized protein HemY